MRFLLSTLLIALSVCSGVSVTDASASSSIHSLHRELGFNTEALTLSYGRCSGFSVMAGTALSANGVQTVINTGSAGVAPGTALTGDLMVSAGTKETNTQAAIDCAADELTLYDQLKGATCTATNTLQASDLAGITLIPGVYCSSSGLFSISASTVTLDAQGNSNAQWIFQTSTSLTTSTGTSFIMKNGALAANVYWQIGSSASIGYSSSFVGNILAYTSISLDHDATVQGRLFAQAAISFAGGDTITAIASDSASTTTNAPAATTTTAPAATTTVKATTQLATTVSATTKAASSSSSSSNYSPITVSFGRCNGFSLMAATSMSADGVQTVIHTGSAGVAPGTSLTGNMLVSGGAKEVNSQASINCAADQIITYEQLKSAICTPANNNTSTDLSGLTLTPGVYCSSSGRFIISSGTVTLDGLGDPNAQFIFQTATTLSTSTATSFILKNGASAANVFWQVGTSAAIGYSSSFVGSVLAYTSIAVDTSATINGRLFAQTGLTFAGNDQVTSTGPASPTAAPASADTTQPATPTKSGAESIASTSTFMLAVLSALAVKGINLQL